jgi:hypothetical protein
MLLKRRTIPDGHVNGFQKKYPYLKDDYRIMVQPLIILERLSQKIVLPSKGYPLKILSSEMDPVEIRLIR